MGENNSTPTCSYYGKIRKPIAEVFDAVYRADKLHGFFATGVASANLEPGTTVQWSFHDFPEFGPFPVKVVAVKPNASIHLQWGSGIEDGWTDIHFTFESLEDGSSTLVRVTESGWPATEEGHKRCTENAGGWANMVDCLKCYVEHGFNLREFMF